MNSLEFVVAIHLFLFNYLIHLIINHNHLSLYRISNALRLYKFVGYIEFRPTGNVIRAQTRPLSVAFFPRRCLTGVTDNGVVVLLQEVK